MLKSALICVDLSGHCGTFSSIHLRGRFITFTSPPFIGVPATLLSEKRVRSGRTGQGRMLDAETVKHAAKNVRPKRDETNARRWVRRRTLWMDILCLTYIHIVVEFPSRYSIASRCLRAK
ncbi:hypothetical protein BDZ97DRAFT_1773368 [Flammula alnicola]|nr:hypothetical protein BDZ97DRAFT_1773368 [Flammula alnicola]